MLEPVTISDVANLAGVSIKTVSRVANQSPHVRPETREKVQSIIDRLNYRPNPVAVRLGRMNKGRSRPASSLT